MFRGWNKKFFDAWSPEMAYVLGFMFADGSVWRGRRENRFFAFYSTDLAIIESIRSHLLSEHKISIKRRSDVNPRWKTVYFLQIGSKDACMTLEGLGVIQNKSLIMNFPKVPSCHLGSFVRGYFDGDGNVSFGKYWRKGRNKWGYQFSTSFTSGSRPFLVGLWQDLRQNNIVVGGHISTKKRGYELVFSQKDSVALYALMYNNVPAGLFLERKFAVFQEAFQKLNIAVVAQFG